MQSDLAGAHKILHGWWTVRVQIVVERGMLVVQRGDAGETDLTLAGPR